LWEKYERGDQPDKISRYLQHCTEQRVESKSWDIGEMLRDVTPDMRIRGTVASESHGSSVASTIVFANQDVERESIDG